MSVLRVLGRGADRSVVRFAAMRVVVPLGLALLVACAGGDQGSEVHRSEVHGHLEGPEARPDEAGATRASREVARSERRAVAESDGTTDPATPSVPSPSRPVLSVHPVTADEAEDGLGNTVAATDPVAFDVDGRRFPPGGTDPVLIVGPLRFRHYLYPRPGVLRFTAADRGALPVDAPVVLQFGEDETTRVELAASVQEAL